MGGFWETFFQDFKNCSPMFVLTFCEKGGLKYVIFRLLVAFLPFSLFGGTNFKSQKMLATVSESSW
jgi:hypothetical protein